MRAGGRLGVVLHREGGQVEAGQAFDDVVVQPDVGDDDAAVAAAVVRRRRAGLVERGVDREAVVVRGDLHLGGGAVEHRLVDAAVPVAELVGAVPERPAQELVAEADAEERDLAVQDGAEQLDLVAGGARVPWTVGEEDAARGVVGQRGEHALDVGDGGGLRHDDDADAALGEADRRHGLDAEVDRDDRGDRGLARVVLQPLTLRLHGVRLLGGDLAGQVGARHLRGRLHLRHELLDGARVAVADQVLAREDAGAHHALLAQAAGQRAGVDVGDADDALLGELLAERVLRAPARHAARGVADHVAGDPDLAGLGVLVVHAGVADVRRGHDDDLPVVGRVRQRLLVAGHAGGEDDLAERGAGGAVRAATIGSAVLEDERCGLRGGLCCGCHRDGHRASCWCGSCWCGYC